MKLRVFKKIDIGKVVTIFREANANEIPVSDNNMIPVSGTCHFINLIKEWLTINPNMVFFIENPRGMLRKMPFMQEFKRHTVWYCQYGDERAKPTDIWTNSVNWVPRPICHNGNKNCHHQPAPRGSKTGTQGRKGSFDRSKIPHELCIEILKSTL